MIKTPNEFPDHYTIGNYFKGIAEFSSGRTSEIYWCDSYDTEQGFWLTSLTVEGRRINVSERAIDSTYHTVWHNNPQKVDSLFCKWGKLTPEEVELIQNHIQYQTGMIPINLRIA